MKSDFSILMKRAIICKNKEVIPMSFDFTPESERERIKYLVIFELNVRCFTSDKILIIKLN
jgi:hypothetical protein